MWFVSLGVYAQEQSALVYKKFAVTSDTIVLHNNSINNSFFKVTNQNGEELDSLSYWIDFKKGKLVLKKDALTKTDSIKVRYLNFPSFLTQKYSLYDVSRITSGTGVLQSLQKDKRQSLLNESPFDGLQTSGSITRGVTIGNNQNAVLNSVLDLQISGKLSENITLRASIQDNNIPIQNNGYSQKLDQFDQVFIELSGNQWAVRAGDLFLENRTSSLLNFNKKVQGLAAQFTLGKKEKLTSFYHSIGVVRGQYAKSTFTGIEGNQGPYKLKGNNGELYVMVISGSERIYVNGILLQRGENNQYVIDYNAGEIIFNATYPITSEMRINVEYQYSDRNYNRFVTYHGINHKQNNWYVSGHWYAESDIKNQSLQQTLSDDQKRILSLAGDDTSAMNAPSAIEESFNENRIQYKKSMIDGIEFFEYSTNPTDVLYNVRFSLVGNNQGNYILQNPTAVQKIYEFVPPVNSIKQGNYEPIVKLIPPTAIQMGVLNAGYENTDKTKLSTEIGISKKDQNLFSATNDNDNIGLAGKINLKQKIVDKKWKAHYFNDFQFVQNTFKPIERMFNIEFNRDWSITQTFVGNQSLLNTGMVWELPQKGNIKYQYDFLGFGEQFSGNKHGIVANFKLNKWQLSQNTSVLKSNSLISQSSFVRNQSQARYLFYKNWIGSTFRAENNQERITETQSLSKLSQRFNEYGVLLGRGDSTKVFAQIGYLQRVNDSLVSGNLQRVNQSQSYYLKSKLIQNDKNDLSLFVNYRLLQFEDVAKANIPSLNSRLLYNSFWWQQLVQTNTLFETLSGTVARQDFTYVEVDAGRGVYTWIDYNNNGIQEISEFEVAKFIDQAKFIRIFLPNQTYVKTHQNKFSQSLTLNPMAWQQTNGFKKILSYFYNQTAYLIDRKSAQNGHGFNLNPFSSDAENELGLTTSIRNSLFYNRGKQKHSTTYHFIENGTKNLLSIGLQEGKNQSHQITYNHLLKRSWNFQFSYKNFTTSNFSQNFETRNYVFKGHHVQPKIGYIFSNETALDVFYEFQQKNNHLNFKEKLNQQRIGLSFTYVGKKQVSLNGEFSYYNNQYTGALNSPIIYQLLEGLSPGSNFVWRLLMQRNITSYLDVNINYQGRKNETTKTIHTGNIQLRAHF